MHKSSGAEPVMPKGTFIMRKSPSRPGREKFLEVVLPHTMPTPYVQRWAKAKQRKKRMRRTKKEKRRRRKKQVGILYNQTSWQFEPFSIIMVIKIIV